MYLGSLTGIQHLKAKIFLPQFQMFVQKLKLDQNKSYSTTTSLENLIENLHLSFNHVAVLTPYSSASDTIETVKENLKKPKSSSKLTPAMFLGMEGQFRDRFDCTHFPVVEYSLMDKFGFDLSVIGGPLIVLDEKCPLQRLSLSKFFIRNDESGSFVVLFILSKMFTGAVVTRKARKTKMFFEIFGIGWDVISYDDISRCQDPEKPPEESGSGFRDCLVFMDGYLEIYSERVFVLGNRRPAGDNGLEDLSIDLSLAGKFKHRVEDVLRALTPAVVNGKRSLDSSRFRNVSK